MPQSGEDQQPPGPGDYHRQDHLASPIRYDWRYVATIAAIASVYYVTAKFGLSVAFVAEQVTAVWPPTGISLVAILLFGYRVWPGIALGAFLINAVTNQPVLTAMGIALGNTLEAILGAYLLRRIGFHPSLRRLRDVYGFVILAAFVSTTASATIGVLSLCLSGLVAWSSFGPVWLVWWLGDVMGDLLVAPFLLAWATRPRLQWHGWRLAEAALLFLTLITVAYVVFTGRTPGVLSRYELKYIVFPFVIWAAFRFRQREVATVNILISGIALWGAINGGGPFITTTLQEGLIMMQLFMAVVAVTAMVLGAATEERKETARALRAARDELEMRVHERTAELTRLNATLTQEIGERRQAEEELRKTHDELELRVEERTGELAKVNLALHDANKTKDEFLATLAHELRNPLAPMRNAIEVMRRVNTDPMVVNRAREIIDRQANTLARLVDDLLDVSRLQRGKVTLHKEIFDPAGTVTRAIETCEHQIAARGHHVTVSLPPNALLVNADPTRLEQILCNLLTNAAKYTQPRGEIRVSLEGDEDCVVFRVSDNGIGISQELLPRVFELFAQGNQMPDRSEGGLGIGLTLVRHLVQMHGGSVNAFSQGANRGTEFVVRLPAAKGVAETAVPREPSGVAALETPSKRVLVIEDSPDSRETLEVLLRTAGHKVESVEEGVEGIQRALKFQPDIALVDIGLPGIDGYEVARQIRASMGDRIFLIALTGYGQPKDRQRAFEAGFQIHLVKPVDFDELLKVIALHQTKVQA